MEELKSLVIRAQSGDADGFVQIVRRFQDMAYGCAYSILGDFHLSEDVAQEAFMDAYRKLGSLRAPEAFPAWFRRIIFKHCNRIIRRKRLQTISLGAGMEKSADVPGPAETAQRRETAREVLEAVAALPEHQRMVTTLFYINGYSQKEIAEFLEVPLTAVKKRLHDARNKLKERMLDMVRDTIRSRTPDAEEKAEQVRLLLSVAKYFSAATASWL